MIQTCYLRFPAPGRTAWQSLREATAQPVPGKYLLSGTASDGKAETLDDHPSSWTMFGQFFVVEYGKQLLTRFEYDCLWL